MAEKLTPSQELILEVLRSRYRLGQTEWTLEVGSGIRKAVRDLEERGLIRTRPRSTTLTITPTCVYAALTVAGLTKMFPRGVEASLTPLEIERNRLRLANENLIRQLESVGL
jgi:hypothetical protein